MKNAVIGFILGIIFILVGDGIQESSRQNEINALNVKLRQERELKEAEYQESKEVYIRLNDLYYSLRKKCDK